MNFFKKLFGKEDNKEEKRPVKAHGSAPQKAPARLADAKVWNVGDTILGEYKVVGSLGEGGMGAVYHVVRSQSTGYKFAVKKTWILLATNVQR
ncbi:MAG: hypothetical protein WCQ99_06760 [Pseudomonadota bacterium]